MTFTSRSILLLCSLMLVAVGCGGRSRSTPPPGARWEAGTVKPHKDMGPDMYQQPLDRSILKKDRYVPPPPPLDHGTPPPPPPDHGTGKCTATGGVCGGGKSPCCGGSICVPLPTGVSICTMSCTPDNLSTPLINEDSCPNATTTKSHICGNIGTGAKQHYCLKTCKPELGKNSCPAGLACHPTSAALTGQIDLAACVYRACNSGMECPINLSKTCTTTGSVAQCNNAGLPTGARCGPPNGQPGAPLRCVVPGVCDTISGLCAPHKLGKATAKVGDPCKDDRHCGAQMVCDMQGTTSMGRVHARNGYCVIQGCAFKTFTAFTCPSGSVCHRLHWGGRCLLSCDLKTAKSCRGYASDKLGDYECRGWNNLSMGGAPIVYQPVCEPGDSMACDMLQNSSLDCSSVGLQANPTKMGCRDPANGKTLTNKYDPNGYCLDDTASGK